MSIPSRCAVVFDCDGTLIPKNRSLCQVIDNAALTPKANAEMVKLRKYYLGRAVKGLLTVDEEADWLKKTLDTYIQHGLTRDRARGAVQSVALRPGAKECLEWLHRSGVPTAIVSYGATPFIEKLLDANGARRFVNSIYSATLESDPETGRFHRYDHASLVLPVNKGEWSRHFADSKGIPHENLIAVGDSGGDKFLGHLKERRLGIAKDNADAAKIAPFMGKVVITEDFVPVRRWLRRTMSLIK